MHEQADLAILDVHRRMNEIDKKLELLKMHVEDEEASRILEEIIILLRLLVRI